MSGIGNFLNGAPATPEALARLAATGFGHFTTMQVRAGGVAGLDLHLARLEHATRVLFDAELAPEAVRAHLRTALGEAADASVRIAVTACNWSAREMPGPARIETLIRVSAPAAAAATPVRLRSVVHAHYLPQIKHGGNFDLLDLRRRARAAGYDDALLLDRDGHVSEGPTWNLGVVSGDTLLWPQAEQLDGVTMRLLSHVWAGAGGAVVQRPLHLAEIREPDAVFCCNSAGVWPVASIDGNALAAPGAGFARVCGALVRVPMQAI